MPPKQKKLPTKKGRKPDGEEGQEESEMCNSSSEEERNLDLHHGDTQMEVSTDEGDFAPSMVSQMSSSFSSGLGSSSSSEALLGFDTETRNTTTDPFHARSRKRPKGNNKNNNINKVVRKRGRAEEEDEDEDDIGRTSLPHDTSSSPSRSSSSSSSAGSHVAEERREKWDPYALLGNDSDIPYSSCSSSSSSSHHDEGRISPPRSDAREASVNSSSRVGPPLTQRLLDSLRSSGHGERNVVPSDSFYASTSSQTAPPPPPQKPAANTTTTTTIFTSVASVRVPPHYAYAYINGHRFPFDPRWPWVFPNRWWRGPEIEAAEAQFLEMAAKRMAPNTTTNPHEGGGKDEVDKQNVPATSNTNASPRSRSGEPPPPQQEASHPSTSDSSATATSPSPPPAVVWDVLEAEAAKQAGCTLPPFRIAVSPYGAGEGLLPGTSLFLVDYTRAWYCKQQEQQQESVPPTSSGRGSKSRKTKSTKKLPEEEHPTSACSARNDEEAEAVESFHLLSQSLALIPLSTWLPSGLLLHATKLPLFPSVVLLPVLACPSQVPRAYPFAFQQTPGVKQEGDGNVDPAPPHVLLQPPLPGGVRLQPYHHYHTAFLRLPPHELVAGYRPPTGSEDMKGIRILCPPQYTPASPRTDLKGVNPKDKRTRKKSRPQRTETDPEFNSNMPRELKKRRRRSSAISDGEEEEESSAGQDEGNTAAKGSGLPSSYSLQHPDQLQCSWVLRERVGFILFAKLHLERRRHVAAMRRLAAALQDRASAEEEEGGGGGEGSEGKTNTGRSRSAASLGGALHMAVRDESRNIVEPAEEKEAERGERQRVILGPITLDLAQIEKEIREDPKQCSFYLDAYRTMQDQHRAYYQTPYFWSVLHKALVRRINQVRVVHAQYLDLQAGVLTLQDFQDPEKRKIMIEKLRPRSISGKKINRKSYASQLPKELHIEPTRTTTAKGFLQ